MRNAERAAALKRNANRKPVCRDGRRLHRLNRRARLLYWWNRSCCSPRQLLDQG